MNATRKSVIQDDLIFEFLSGVEEIPEGCVALYGQIAHLIRREKNSRPVGKVLNMSELYGKYPCHRMINHAGMLAPHFFKQHDQLLSEGVTFLKNDCADMNQHQWDCLF